MTPTRDLDFAPLTRGVGFTARLGAARADNRMVVAGTVAVLLIIVPMAVFVGLLATDNATDVGGLAVLAMCFGGGVYVVVDIARKSGGGAALDDFARVNDLVLVRGSTVPHYGGSLFADESHAVSQSVRTKERLFVEVGDRFPTTAPHDAAQPNRPQLFLRARLAGPATRDPRDLVPAALHDVLTGFAGAYTLEVSGDELTLFGSDPLDVERPGRVQEAFALAEELAARANASIAAAPEPTSSGISVPVPTRRKPRQGSTPRARTVIGWTLALVVGAPLAIAIIMSILDDHLRGRNGEARLVVWLIVLATSAAAARLVKAAMTVRRDRRSRTPE